MANIVQRTINEWFNRLLDATSERSFSDQDERYAPNRTKRDYIFNTLGLGLWGMVFPLLTVIITQLSGVEKAGMFSLAFVVGLLLSYIANYGVRTYQVSDLSEEHSFSDYQINRLITSLVMIVIGILYCTIRGYETEMFTISIAVFVYRMLDSLGDVYEGRLQQVAKLYLAGISQTTRSLLVVVAFSISLVITRNLAISCIIMAVAALATLVLLTIPLAYFETPKSRKASLRSIKFLFKQCFPLFIAIFLFNLIDAMPRFIMEGALTYDNQLYFNALYFPAQFILIGIQFVYKPQLVRFANLWAERSKRKRFDLMILAVLGVIVLFTGLMLLAMGSFGLPLLSFMYGIDFEPMRNLCFMMLIAGGVIASIDFLYQMITVLRQQKSAMLPYAITLAFAVVLPIILVNVSGLGGIITSYFIVMVILFVLLLLQYIRMRRDFTRESYSPFQTDRDREFNPYEAIAERAQRAERDKRLQERDRGRERERERCPKQERSERRGGQRNERPRRFK
jgi:O-antigen/teichoic acid export membrane protein